MLEPVPKRTAYNLSVPLEAINIASRIDIIGLVWPTGDMASRLFVKRFRYRGMCHRESFETRAGITFWLWLHVMTEAPFGPGFGGGLPGVVMFHIS